MNSTKTAVLIGLTVLWALQTQGDLRAQEKPVVKIPSPGSLRS